MSRLSAPWRSAVCAAAVGCRRRGGRLQAVEKRRRGGRRRSRPAGGEQVTVDGDAGVGVQLGVPLCAREPNLVFDPVRELAAVGHHVVRVDDPLLPVVRESGHRTVFDERRPVGLAGERQDADRVTHHERDAVVAGDSVEKQLPGVAILVDVPDGAVAAGKTTAS
jgi:hypothetical protein